MVLVTVLGSWEKPVPAAIDGEVQRRDKVRQRRIEK
jgi:hypothetical protein